MVSALGVEYFRLVYKQGLRLQRGWVCKTLASCDPQTRHELLALCWHPRQQREKHACSQKAELVPEV